MSLPTSSSPGSDPVPAETRDEELGIEFESEFEHTPVPEKNRKSLFSVSAVWFGFPMVLTSAIFAGVIVAYLGFLRGILAIIIGNVVLLAYVGALSYLAGASGENFALQATRTFGRKGYIVASGFLATIVVGWFAFQTGLTGSTLHASFGWNETLLIGIAGILYVAITFIGIRALSILGMIAAPIYVILGFVAIGIVAANGKMGDVFSYKGVGGAGAMTIGAAATIIIASFADSGTMTADFCRWAKNGRHGFLAAFSAFPIANFIAQLFGAVIVGAGVIASATVAGGDFTGILVKQDPILAALVVVFVFVNLGSVCTHCLYNGAVGWSHIVNGRMRVLTIILGIIGIIAALAGVWSLFLDWLNILGIFVPSIGAIIIVDQLILRSRSNNRTIPVFHYSAFGSWIAGAVAAGLVHFYVPAWCEAVIGMVVAGLVYYCIEISVGDKLEKVDTAASSQSAP